jgi:hypothetical protein
MGRALDHTLPAPGAPAETEAATVHDVRPVAEMKTCPVCLSGNVAGDAFCTSCGAELEVMARAGSTEIDPALASGSPTMHNDSAPRPTGTHPAATEPSVVAISAESLVSPVTDRGRSRRNVFQIAALVAATAGLVVFAVLWQLQSRHADHLARSLASTQATLAQTQATLAVTKTKLTAATSLSEKRRRVLVRAQDVLTKVDPLLSSVDDIQHKAGALGEQGSTVASDADTFIGTVADLVNYLVDTSPEYVDYSYVNQAIDDANSELATIRADEATLNDNNSAYGDSSSTFEGKATAFTGSVRALQTQLHAAVGK